MSAEPEATEDDVFAADSLIEAVEARLDELMDAGAGDCCPAGSRTVEAMLQRYRRKPSRYLLARIERALAALESEFSHHREHAQELARKLEKSCPESADTLHSLLAQGQFHDVAHLAIRKNEGDPSPADKIRKLRDQVQSGELVNPAYSGTLSFDDFLRSQEEEILNAVYRESGDEKNGAGTSDNHRETSTEPLTELRSIKHFRDSWVKMNSEKLLAQAIADTPKDAGPLNSHRLAIQSLTAMRDLSPEYLNRFLSYLETLLWLEKAGESIGLKPRAKAKNTRQNR